MNRRNRHNKVPSQQVLSHSQAAPILKELPKHKTTIFTWGATPFVITGFGIVMREVLQNLYRQHPGMYNFFQVGINYGGDWCDESIITGGLENGRYIQWPAGVSTVNGAYNPYGHVKFLEVLRAHLPTTDIDAIFLFEDPFIVGGIIPGSNPPVNMIDAVRAELATAGKPYIPIVGYFPIDGIPKKAWVDNIAKIDIPITYLRFGAQQCVNFVPALNGRLGIIPHGVNPKEFFPIPKEEARSFKRAMFGEHVADKFMLLNVNRNQLRKLVPSTMLGFKEFQKQVNGNAFLYLNMRPADVGWNLVEVCNALGLQIGKDVLFPPDFNVQKGLPIEDLNKVFNAADVLASTAIGGGWELSVSQAFATRTTVVAPANTSHIELCGNQDNLDETRGILYRSGSNLSQLMIFPMDNEVVRPLPDIDHMVEKLKWAYDNQEVCRKIEENAYQWTVKELSWEKNIAPQFHNAFSIAKQIKQARLQGMTANAAAAKPGSVVPQQQLSGPPLK